MDLRKLKDKATEAFTKGKFAKAAEAYEEYCAADPKDHQARLRMGDAWAKAGKKDKAIGAYTKAAEGFAKEGFLPRAIAASKLILELDPAHQGVQKMLADLYARKSGPAMPGSKPAGATAIGVEQKVPGSTTDAAFANRKDAIALDGPPAPAAKPRPAAPKADQPPSPMNRADAIELPEYEIPMETVSAGSSAVPVAARGPSPQRNARAIEFDEGPAGPTGPAALENTTIDLGVRVAPSAAPPAPAEAVEPAGIAIEVETSAGEDSQLPIVGVEVSVDPPAPPPPPQFLGDAATPQFAGDPMTPQPSGPDVPIIVDPEPVSEPSVAAIPPPNPSGPDLPISVDLRAVPPPPPRPSVPDVILEGEPISEPVVAAVPPPPPPPSMPEIIEAEPISDPVVATVLPPPPPPSLPPQGAVPAPRPSVPDLTQDAELIEEPAPPRPSGPEITFEENPPQPPPLPPHRPELQVITESPTVVVSPLATQTDEEIVRSGEGAAPPGLRPKPKGPEAPPPAAPRIYIPQPGGTSTVEDVVLTAPVAPPPAGSTDLERSLEIFSHFETEDFLPPARAAAAAAPPPAAPVAAPAPVAAAVPAATAPRKARSFTELELEGDSLLHAVEEAAVVGLHQRGQADATLAQAGEEMMEAPDELKNPSELQGLPKIPLFSDLPEEAFIALFERCPLKRVGQGEIVIQQGSLGDSFYVICAGAVRVFRIEGERRRDLATLEEGAFFGEMALLAGSPRTASVEGHGEDTQLLEISAAILTELSLRYPPVAAALKKFCRQRLLSNVMATAPIFQPFSRQDRRELVQRFRARDVHKGDVLIKEGNSSDGMYIILSGEVEVRVKGAPVASLKEGDLFGEMSLLTKSKATATVSASKRTSLLRLPREDFDQLIMSHPQVLVLVSELTESRQRQNAAVASQQGGGGGAAPMV